MKSRVFITVCGAFFLMQAASQMMELDLDCEFGMHEIIFGEPEYTCTLSNISFDFTNPFYFIRLTGTHLEGRENSDVTVLRIIDSSINTIPTNIFNVLTNLRALEITDSGTIAIIPPSFSFAQRLEYIRLVDNNIPVLFDFSFFLIGSTMESLELRGNGITSLDADVFFGLVNLRHLSLGDNNLRTLSPRVFAPLTNLRSLFVYQNFIEILDGRLFNNNRQLETISFERNSINSIGPNILNPLDHLRTLWLVNNNCIDLDFEIGDDLDRGDVREALQRCFNNFIDPPITGENFIFEVQGNLTIFDINGYELFRIQN